MAIRVTSTGQTTFVKKVVIGTPVRSVTGSGANFTSLSDVTITSASNKQIITFDSASQKFINTDSATLANLTVSGNILPATDSASDLGSATKKFKDLFLSGSTITLGTLRLKDSGGGLAVADSAGQEKPLSLEGSKSQIRSFFSSGGDISYDSSKGQFSIDVETVYTKANFDSDLGAALDGGTGITYDSSSDTISITNTGVTAATYGSASQVPQIAVNAQGQITSASNVSIAGVTGVTYDSSNGALTVSTSAGSSFTDSINLNPFNTTNLSEGTNLYYTTARSDSDFDIRLATKSTTNLSEGNNLYYTTSRADSAFDARFDSSFDERLATKSTTNLSEGSNQYFTTARARSSLSGGTGITYNSSTGAISTTDADIVHDNLSGFVANEHIDHSGVSIIAGKGLSGGGTIASSRTIDIDSANVRGMLSGGTGISYNSGTGAITTTDGEIVHDNLSGFVADEHVAHSGVSIVAGKGLSGGGTIASSRTIDIDSANVRGMFSGSNGISYTSGTGDIRAPQPLDSAANPTFNQLRGPAEFIIDPAAIGDATGTVKIMGNLQVQGTQTTINSSTIVLKDKNIVIADSAADSSALNGAGFTWGDSAIANNPTFNYNHAEARFDANRSISASTFVGNLAGNATGSAATVTNAAQTNITSLGTLTGLTSTGDVAVDSAGGFLFDVSDKALEFGDNYKATFGDGGDLSIRHSGSHSIISDAGTGDLLIAGSQVRIMSSNISENMIRAITDGAVELYHDNSKKFETTDSGAKVTGQIVADSSTIGNIRTTGTKIGAANQFANSFLDFDDDNDPGVAGVSATNNVTLGSVSGMNLLFDCNGNDNNAFMIGSENATSGSATKHVVVAPSGNVGIGNDNPQQRLVVAGGDVAFDSAAAILFDKSDKALEFGDNYKATFGAGADLAIFHDGGNSAIIDQGTGGLFIRGSSINIDDTSSNDYITATQGGAVTLFHNGSSRFQTTDSGVFVQDKLFLDSAGNTSRMNLEQVNSFSGDILRIKTAGGTVDIGPANSSYSHFVTDRNKFFFNRKIVVDDILSSYNGNLELQKAEITKLTLSDSGATVTGQLVADSATLTLATITGLGVGSTSEALSPVSGQLQVASARHRDWSSSNTDIDALIAGSNFGNIIEGRLNAHLVLGIRNNDTTDGVSIISSDSSYGTNSLYTNHVVSFKADGDIEIDSAGAIMYDKSDKALEFGDNYKATFGASADLEIYHNGTRSEIKDTGTGVLCLISNQIKIESPTGEDVARFIENSDVILYQNNTERFRTTSSGTTTTGTSYITGNIVFEGSTANSNETTLTVTDPTADRTITLPDATGTVLTTGNSNTPTTTTSSSDADFVLIDDGGTMKKITPANLGIGSGGGGGLDSAAVLTVAGTGVFNTTGEAGTAATAGTATNVTVSANNSTNETVYPTFVDGATGTQGLETDTGLTYNPSTGRLTAVSFFAPTFQHNGGTVTVDASEGKVVLTHQGSTKLETSSSGIDVNGSVTVGSGDTFVLDGSETTTSSTSQTALVTVAKATYGAAKFLVTAVSSSERHITEIYATHDGTTGVATEYGTVTTNGILATYDVDINGDNFRLLATPASSTSTTFKVVQTLIEA